jgi:hypothetical protein
VRRAYANGRLKHTKTRLGTRAVPLQALAVEALDRHPRSENPFDRAAVTATSVFGATVEAGSDEGWNRAAGHLYDLRHLRHLRPPRRVSVFAVSRFMAPASR